MPKQSALRWIKHCRFYERRGNFVAVPPTTRGLYVLYRKKSTKPTGKSVFEVVYIGVAGLSKDAKTGIGARLRSHDRMREDWTHYSFFEVHDNIWNDEIRELEGLFLCVFKDDRRIKLENSQLGFGKLKGLTRK